MPPAVGIFWGQLSGVDPDAPAFLALRRWFEGLTLSSPVAGPSRVGLWCWLAGLGGLLVLAMLAQGPKRALGQLLDPRGHARLLGGGLRRLRGSARVVAIMIGAFVLGWSVTQFAHYSDPKRLNELYVLLENRQPARIAVEHGVLAALVPLRDVCSLGDFLLLLLVVTILVFQLTTNRWSGSGDPFEELESPLPRWTTLCWGMGWLYVLYRFAMMLTGYTGYPLGDCIMVEGLVVPLLMVGCDGLLLAWLLVELRDSGPGSDTAAVDLRGLLAVWPAAMLGCVAAVPARYLATAAWLVLPYAPATVARVVLGPLLSGWGIAWLQGAALLTLGIVGVAAWSAGQTRGLAAGYWRLLREAGGLLTALLVWWGLAAGLVASAAYLAVLSLPRQPWLLTAADAYAHYATLAVGLVGLGCLVELGQRGLPRAGLVVDSGRASRPDTWGPNEVDTQSA